MSEFVEVIDTELGQIEQRQVDVKTEIEKLESEATDLEARREGLLDLRVIYTASNGASRIPERKQPIRPVPKTTRPKPVIAKQERSEPAAMDPAQKTGERSTVIDALKTIGEPCRMNEIITESGLTRRPVQEALGVLVESGRVVKSGQRGGTRYALAGSPAAPSDGTPAPLPAPEITDLQQRVIAAVTDSPRTTGQIAGHLGANFLKVENALKGLHEHHGKVEQSGDLWSLAEAA